MKRLILVAVLAAGACSGPTETEPEPENPILFAEDFEGGLPAWEYFECTASIENDGDNYLLLTAARGVNGPFGFCYYANPREGTPPVALDVKLEYKTAELHRNGSGNAAFQAEGYKAYLIGHATEWGRVNFRVNSEREPPSWPTSYEVSGQGFEAKRPGMAIAVDDIEVRAAQ